MDNATSQVVDYEGVLWLGLHFGLAWATYAQWIMVFIMDLIRIGVRKLKFSESGMYQLADDAKSLSKIPQHLAIMTEDDAGLQDLANMVVWTALLGISCVTIHNRNGMKPDVFSHFVKICQRRKAEMKLLLQINIHNEFWAKSCTAAGCDVLISSVKCSRHNIVEASRVLCRKIQDGSLRASDINLDVVNESVRGPLPEPDLAINFGGYPSLHGFNPWDMRLTEIITAQSTKNISYPQFFDVLKQFSSTKQRFGK